MKLLFILSLFASEPEDRCEIYLLDMMWATFSPRWEVYYDSSLTAFRSMQGCLDLKRWYLLYQAKLRQALYRWFGMRYRYHRLQDYNDSLELHQVEPWFRLKEELHLHLMITPTFWKREIDLGAGLSWFQSGLNYLEGFLIIEDLFNNFSLKHTPPSPEREVYVEGRYPYRFTLEGARGTPGLRAKLYLEWTTEAKMKLEDPLQPRTRRFSSWAGRVRVEGGVWDRVIVGCNAQFRGRGETVHFADSTTGDSLREFWVEPLLSYELTGDLRLQFRYRHTYKRRNLYTRRWTGLDLMLTHHPSSGVELGFGYQRSRREIRGIEDPLNLQSRAVISLELKLLNQIRFWIVEGIELDGFPKETLRRPHNHTYVALFIPF